MLDSNTAQVLLGLFGVVNTALLVYQAVRLSQVHGAVNGAREAAVEAAHNAGVAAMLAHDDATRAVEQGRAPLGPPPPAAG